jgi:hypothetical protein
MNSRILSLVVTVASLGALCAPAMAAKSPLPGKSTVASAKTTVASAKTTMAKQSVARKAHKGACKNVAKPAAVKP